MASELVIEPPALHDIQQAIDFHESKILGFGEEFEDELDRFFDTLLIVPFFQIRYDQTRCLPLKRFPFMIHYTVDEKKEMIIVSAVFNSFRNPDVWKNR
jgi:hypothetical protein